jgi:hypothetical protein
MDRVDHGRHVDRDAVGLAFRHFVQRQPSGSRHGFSCPVTSSVSRSAGTEAASPVAGSNAGNPGALILSPARPPTEAGTFQFSRYSESSSTRMILRSAGTVLPVPGVAMRGRAAKVSGRAAKVSANVPGWPGKADEAGGRPTASLFLGHTPHCREAVMRASKPSGAVARREVAGQRATGIDRPASPTV